MPSSVTLKQLKNQALDRADMTNTDFIDDARLTDYVNQELSELYDLIVDSYEDYFIKTSTITIANGTEAYNIPSDFYKSFKIFYKENNKRYKLSRFTTDELDDYNSEENVLGASNKYIRYRILGNKIYFSPVPVSSGTIEIFYIPEFEPLTVDSQQITFRIPGGWETFVVCGVAARCLIKEQSDPSMLMMEKQQAKQRIIGMAAIRDTGEPHRVTDISNRFADYYIRRF